MHCFKASCMSQQHLTSQLSLSSQHNAFVSPSSAQQQQHTYIRHSSFLYPASTPTPPLTHTALIAACSDRTCRAAASACPAAADTGTTMTPGSCCCSQPCQAAAAAAGTRSHLLSSSTSGSLWCCVMWRYSAWEKCSRGFLQAKTRRR
jgi:hypothetical protein